MQQQIKSNPNTPSHSQINQMNSQIHNLTLTQK